MKKKSMICLLCMVLIFGSTLSIEANGKEACFVIETQPEARDNSKLYIDGVLATEQQKVEYKKSRDMGIQPYWYFTSETSQGLMINNSGLASCAFTVNGYPDEVIKVSARMILEKKQPLNTYANVTYWDKSTNDFILTFEGYHQVPSNGVYRVRVQYTVYHTPGVYETIEGYSDTWYFNNY